MLLLSASPSGHFRPLGRVARTVGAIHLAPADVNGDGTDEIVTVGFGGVTVLDIDLLEGESS